MNLLARIVETKSMPRWTDPRGRLYLSTNVCLGRADHSVTRGWSASRPVMGAVPLPVHTGQSPAVA